MGELIPNQAVLLKAIVLQEARLSSEIENIVTTSDELYRAMSGAAPESDHHTKEVLRYQEALWHGVEQLRRGRPLSTTLFVELVQIIRQTTIGVRSSPGTQIVNDRTGEVVYTPPEGEKAIRDLLDNLSDYLADDDGVDPLIRLAVGHYQFEAIHPFSDGNGRTGRVINILYLVQRGLIEVPVLYLSRYILQHRAGYYGNLRRVTEQGDWEPWVLYMLDAIEATALDTRSRIIAIRSSLEEAVERARQEMARGYSRELVELVFQQPYTRIRFLERAGIAKRQAGSEYLQELARIGLLIPLRTGRDVIYVNERLMDILTA